MESELPEIEFEPKTRINGSLMLQNAGKSVCLLGSVICVHPDGVQVEVKTPDSHVVNVKLPEPISKPLSGLVEFYGTVQGKTLLCDFHAEHPPEFTKDFDMEQYNNVITLANSATNQ